jgi:RimJ/RimL family protein N-acetyltransferase/ketosteroid isomerase-like protein
MNFWQGKKVRLRSIEPSDAATFLHWNLDSERAQNLDFTWPPLSLAAVTSWAGEQSLHKLENDTFHWVIENIAGIAVGSISTHDCNRRAGTFSYGIDIAMEHRQQGYASEAITLVLKYYFEELRYQKVTVPVHSNNPASIQLHETLGFQQEGVLRRMGYSQGQHFDDLWYGMTAEEFQKIMRETRDETGLEEPQASQLSTDETTQIVIRFNEALNAHDVDAMMRCLTADTVFENTDPPPDGRRYQGQYEVRTFWEDFFSSSQGQKIEIEEIFAAGNRCVMRWVYSWVESDGSHRHVRGIDLYTLVDGLVREKLSYVKG